MGVVRDFIPEGEAVEEKKPFIDFIPEQKVEEVVEVKKEEIKSKQEEREKKSKFQEFKDALTGAVTFKEVEK